MKRKGAGYHHGNLRRALVEATIRLVAEHGTERFTLRAAAKLAGVSDGAPYHHFADKEALLATVAEESFRMLYDEMQSSASKQRGDARKKSQAMGVAYVLFAAKNPSRFRIMFGPLVHSRAQHPDLAEAAGKAYRLVQQALGHGIPEGSARTALKEVQVRAWALVHGLSVLAIDGYLGPDGRNPRKLERLAWDAMRSLEQESRPPESMPRSGSRLRPGRSSTWPARRVSSE